jgi:mannose-6-phosphate isomerase-like protein (cupin superfamily)
MAGLRKCLEEQGFSHVSTYIASGNVILKSDKRANDVKTQIEGVLLVGSKPSNKACTRWVGFCGIFKHFPGFEFFLLPNRIHARPHAGNANRWAAIFNDHQATRNECMDKSLEPRPHSQSAHFVAADEDRFGEHRSLGISTITFKVTPHDSSGLLIIENTFREKGGPARHLHYEQDEWFYVVHGEFQFEVGSEKFQLKPGDSLLAPRQVPHVWAYTGGHGGRILITFMPAGKMEAFFREVTQANAMPPQDPELWRRHGMELVGPPLKVA